MNKKLIKISNKLSWVDASGLSYDGHHDKLSGNVTGIGGDVTGIGGDVTGLND